MYLRNLLRHKYFVFIEACKLGIPLLGLIHDMSKFSPDEFIPYARWFGSSTNREAFDLAWLKHQRRNKHHWQHWLLINDNGKAFYLSPNTPMKRVEPIPMPDRYIKEMVADWKGAARTYGNPGDWYENNKHKIILHPETRQKVLKLLA